MRRRLRPAHTPQRLAELYAAPHDHSRWPDHVLRVERTIEVARSIGPVESVADLSCGSAAVANAVDARRVILGDLAPGYDYQGPIEETLEQIPHVHLYVCTETLEHLDDPDAVLKQIRDKAKTLLLSTPIDNWADPNEEHYWSWSRFGIERMLAAAGWTVERFEVLDFTDQGPWFYRFGIWVAR